MKLQDYSRRKQNVCFDVLDIPEKLLHFLPRKKSTYLATISESFPIWVKITSCEENIFNQKLKLMYTDTTPSWLKGVIKSKKSTFQYFLRFKQDLIQTIYTDRNFVISGSVKLWPFFKDCTPCTIELTIIYNPKSICKYNVSYQLVLLCVDLVHKMKELKNILA